jgi:urease accessory protein
MTTSPVDGPALARLLQLSSPVLPVGGFSYSQGLEAAVEHGWLRDVDGARRWIGDLLRGPIAGGEAAFVARFLIAWSEEPPCAALLARLDQLHQASRESQQLLAETRQMGWSLLALANGLAEAQFGPRAARRLPTLRALAAASPPSYPLVWSCLAVAMAIGPHDALVGYLWSWLENQVMAALKTIPLGQSAGQTLLFELGALLAPIATEALQTAAMPESDIDPARCDDDGPGNFAPGFALASAYHETLYSRLFRS